MGDDNSLLDLTPGDRLDLHNAAVDVRMACGHLCWCDPAEPSVPAP